MKNLALGFCVALFPLSVLAGARGEEKTYACTAESESVAITLSIVLREGELAHVSYSSINKKNGSDCGLDVGDQSQPDSAGSVWERWQDITLVRIKDDPMQSSELGQVLLVFKQPNQYRISINPDTLRANCALHGYLPPSATLSLQSKKCKLKW